MQFGVQARQQATCGTRVAVIVSGSWQELRSLQLLSLVFSPRMCANYPMIHVAAALGYAVQLHSVATVLAVKVCCSALWMLEQMQVVLHHASVHHAIVATRFNQLQQS